MLAASDLGQVSDALIILAAAAVAAVAAQRVGLALVPAYLLAGAVIGPHAFGAIPNPDSLGGLSHFAIILLLFGIGLDLHLDALKGRLLALMIAGGGACVICVLAGWPLAALLGLDAPGALAVSMTLALSSTAVVLKYLGQRRELDHTHGRLSVAILVIQDLAVLAMLAILPALAKAKGGGSEDIPSHTPTLLGVVALLALVPAARWGVPRLLRRVLRVTSPEVLMLLGLVFAVGTAVLTQVLGFSLEMGAFLAGFILSCTPFRIQIGAQIAPVRDVLLAFFFALLGMQFNGQAVLEGGLVVPIALLVMLAAKSVLIAGVCWAVGASGPVSLTVGTLLAQGGEFSLVLLGFTTSLGLLTDQQSALLVAVVILSLLLTPSAAWIGRGLAKRLSKFPLAPWARARSGSDSAHGHGMMHGHVLIAGFGPAGRRTLTDLGQEGVPCLVIEMNPATIEAEGALGRPMLMGDAGNADVLRAAGIEHAIALVLAVPDEEAIRRACQQARQIRPDLLIAVRSRTARGLGHFLGLGADLVVADELAGADSLAMQLVDALRVRGLASGTHPAPTIG